jgi:hypothetical protein
MCKKTENFNNILAKCGFLNLGTWIHPVLEMLDLELFTINTVIKFMKTKNSISSF